MLGLLAGMFLPRPRDHPGPAPRSQDLGQAVCRGVHQAPARTRRRRPAACPPRSTASDACRRAAWSRVSVPEVGRKDRDGLPQRRAALRRRSAAARGTRSRDSTARRPVAGSASARQLLNVTHRPQPRAVASRSRWFRCEPRKQEVSPSSSAVVLRRAFAARILVLLGSCERR